MCTWGQSFLDLELPEDLELSAAEVDSLHSAAHALVPFQRSSSSEAASLQDSLNLDNFAKALFHGQ